MRKELVLPGVLLTAAALVQFVNSSFLSAENIRDVLVQVAPFAIMGCGAAFVVILGEIDISIGSMAGLLAAVMGTAASESHWGLPIGVSIGLTLGLGVALGAVNGVLTVYGRVPSIIVTLGMLTGLRGVTELVLGGEWITDLPPGLRAVSIGEWGGVPIPVVIAACVVVFAWTVSRHTPLGLRAYAVGGNPHVADLCGIDRNAIKMVAFCGMGALTALAVLVSVPKLSVIESGIGTGWELFVVTCVVVGGVSIKGGKGALVGVLFAVLLLGTVRTALLYLKLGDSAVYWERAIHGALILFAVLVDLKGRAKQ